MRNQQSRLQMSVLRSVGKGEEIMGKSLGIIRRILRCCLLMAVCLLCIMYQAKVFASVYRLEIGETASSSFRGSYAQHEVDTIFFNLDTRSTVEIYLHVPDLTYDFPLMKYLVDPEPGTDSPVHLSDANDGYSTGQSNRETFTLEPGEHFLAVSRTRENISENVYYSLTINYVSGEKNNDEFLEKTEVGNIGASSENIDPSKIKIAGVFATSFLEEPQYNLYHTADCMVDGNLSTAWIEADPGQGIGEWIQVSFDGKVLLNGFEICAGLQENEDLYNKNSRPQDISVSFSDGTCYDYTLSDTYGGQRIQFDPIQTDSIIIEIKSVYPGWKYEDTCISEVKFF